MLPRWPRGHPAEATLERQLGPHQGAGLLGKAARPGPQGRRWVRPGRGVCLWPAYPVAGKGRAGGEGLWHLWSLLSVGRRYGCGGGRPRATPRAHRVQSRTKRTALASVGFKFVSTWGSQRRPAHCCSQAGVAIVADLGSRPRGRRQEGGQAVRTVGPGLGERHSVCKLMARLRYLCCRVNANPDKMRAKNGTRMAAATEPLLVPW